MWHIQTTTRPTYRRLSRVEFEPKLNQAMEDRVASSPSKWTIHVLEQSPITSGELTETQAPKVLVALK